MATRGDGRRQRRKSERRIERVSRKNKLVIAGVGLFFVGLLAIVMVVSSGGSENPMPQIGDHFHAEYSVSICGQVQEDYAYSQGGIHTHGEGSIHLHPQNSTEAGTNATLARFIAGTGGRLTNSTIILPSGISYKDGDECPDGNKGKLFLKVNNIEQMEIASHVPRDEDVIIIGFGQSD